MTDQPNLLDSAGGPDTLRGEVRSVVYQNPENGYAVIRLLAKGEPGLTTVVGNFGELTPGEVLTLRGRFTVHPRFGRQFEAASFEQSYPATEHGIIRYLSSGMVKGVGRRTAELMVAKFGTDILDVLETEPEKLLKIPGIGKKTLAGIVESWATQRAVRGLMLFLQSHGVPTTFAAPISKLWGTDAIARIQDDPYELAYEIRGIGFKTADTMALKLGFAHDDPRRIQAGLLYALDSQSDQGHCYVPRGELYKQVDRMLGSVAEHDLNDGLEELQQRKRVVLEDHGEYLDTAVFLRKFYALEQEIAVRLHGLIEHPAPSATVEKVRDTLPALEAEAGLTLSDEQRQAVLDAVGHKVFILTGGPGTGKTTIVRMIVAALKKAGLKTKLAAPTGRAAKRLAEAVGIHADGASTIHRLLQYTPDQGFLLGEDSKLKAEALIVDEASMLDVFLMAALLRAMPITCRLVLVGDVSQLPAVGPGNVLADMLDSESIPHARLSTVFRQARESMIVVNAHAINEGGFPREDAAAEPPDKDFFWVKQDEPPRVQTLIAQLVTERIPEIYGYDPTTDIQVLTPMHKGEVGTQALNELLQERLNPLARAGAEIVRGRVRFRPGDRVLQLKNNYDKDVFNGDLGWITEVDPDEGELAAEIDGRIVPYDVTELDELALAYAVSVHKSQGSEYPAVVVPIVSAHYIMLRRNLLYTALTRARKLAVLIGGERSVGMAVKNAEAGKRWTWLRERLLEISSDVL